VKEIRLGVEEFAKRLEETVRMTASRLNCCLGLTHKIRNPVNAPSHNLRPWVKRAAQRGWTKQPAEKMLGS
jgi:hypothetical protein